jgi:hypothetical protein
MNTTVKLRTKKSIIRLCARVNSCPEKSDVDLMRFANGESWTKECAGEQTLFGLIDVSFSLGYWANYLSNESTISILSGKPYWREQWERSVLYRYWAETLRGISLASYEQANPGVILKNRNGDLDLYRTGFTLGNCLALGWLEEAKTLARRMNTGLDHGWFYDGTCNTIQRRTQHFVLRLVANWQGWPERTELPCVFDAPVFNALIEQWRTPDVQALSGLLLEALDRHAEQTRTNIDNDDQFILFDCNGPDQIYNPMEVLSVLRLREVLGLPNPEMPKHPVTDTPLGRELLPASAFPKDELLERVLARVRREYPDLMTA